MSKWQSPPPETCNLCERSLAGLHSFIDGKTRDGPWAIMCLSCHRVNGVGLGMGRGQEFSLFTLEKIRG